MASRLPTTIVAPISALFAILIVLGLTLPGGGDMRSLHGPWTGTVVEPGRAERPITLDVPGRFRVQGIDPNSYVVVHREIVLPQLHTGWALYLDNVRHGMAVLWDGRELGSVGDPYRTDRSAIRHDGPMMVVVPEEAAAGSHTIELRIRGDMYQGGTSGQIRLAPVTAMLHQLQRETGSRMGFALTFALVGSLHLLGAAMRPSRYTELLFGAFTLSVACYAFEHSVDGLPWMQDPHTRHVLRRLLVSCMLGFVVAFTARFVHGTVGLAPRVWMAFLATIAAMAAMGPWWNTTVEFVQDLSVGLLVVPWLLGMVIQAWRQGTTGGGWLFAAMALAAAGAIDEALVTQGIISGARWMYPALCLFLLLCSLAIAQQDRALSDRHRRLVTQSEDAMLEVDPLGKVLHLNPAATELLPGLVVGARLLSAVPPDAQPLVTAHLSRAGTAPTRCEFSLLDGRVVESVATPLDQTARLLVMRDVTRRRRAEDELITAARVETAGMLLGGVAHDFNNLLGALLGHVGLLRMSIQQQDALDRLDRMEQVIERASGLTRRLVAVGGRSHATVSEVEIASLLREVEGTAEPTLPDTTRLSLDIEPGIGSVRASAEDLRHVLLNLLLNARDAAGPYGEISVRATSTDTEVHIEVTDSGPGVDPAILDRIWEPFFTTKGPDQGTGLGLPMARRLLRQHGGSLTYRGDSCFRVSLPTNLQSPPPVSHIGGARIAVVDDEEALRQAFTEALTQAGYVAVAYADAIEALPALVAQPPDLLVTDVVMPGMSGLELALALRELQPGLPVLVVSGFIPASEQVLQDGPTEQLDKPTRAAAVVEAVGRLLQSVRAR